MGCPLTRLEPSTIAGFNSLTVQIENPEENDTKYFSPMNQTTNAVSFRNMQKLQEGTSTSLAFPRSTTYNTNAHFEPSPNADDDDEDEVVGLSCKVPSGKDFNKTKYPGAKTALPNIKSQTMQDFDRSQLRELTSLNFSGLFTFRKHFQTSQEIFFKDYLFIEKIGKGGCGEAYKTFHKLTNQFRVVKKINKHSGYDLIKIDKLNQKLIYEAKLIAAMDHPNIVKAYEIFQDEDQVAIVLEYVEGKDLRQNLQNPLFDSNEAIATIIEQVLSGLVYLHMKGVTHKDIKAENIVLEEANPFSNLKLIDFGFSEIKHRQDTHNNAGTIFYTAPEVLMRGNDKKCDLWCTGVLLYQLAFKELPFKGSTPSEIREQILTKDLNELFGTPQARSKDPLLINLLRKLIARDLKKRYSAEEALNDPFIQKYARKPEIEPDDFETFNVYKKKTAMELVLSSVFVHNLMSREEKSNFVRIFRALDTKRRGFLSSDDFQSVDFSSSQEAVKAEISQKAQKGQLALTNMIISCVDLNNKDVIRKLFTYLDFDEDLFINLEDVYNVLEKYIDKNVLKEIKSQLKTLNKKQISYLDFRKLLKMF